MATVRTMRRQHGILMKSPNGTEFRIEVNDYGDLQVMATGISGAQCAASIPQNPQRRETKLERYKKRLEEHDKYRETLENIVKELEEAKYQVGDVVVHPQYGVCMVQQVEVRSESDIVDLASNVSSLAGPSQKVSLIDGPIYSLSNPMYDYLVCSEKEITPYTNASKTLYGNK